MQCSLHCCRFFKDPDPDLGLRLGSARKKAVLVGWLDPLTKMREEGLKMQDCFKDPFPDPGLRLGSIRKKAVLKSWLDPLKIMRGEEGRNMQCSVQFCRFNMN